jgi:hypothetical protein
LLFQPAPFTEGAGQSAGGPARSALGGGEGAEVIAAAAEALTVAAPGPLASELLVVRAAAVADRGARPGLQGHALPVAAVAAGPTVAALGEVMVEGFCRTAGRSEQASVAASLVYTLFRLRDGDPADKDTARRLAANYRACYGVPLTLPEPAKGAAIPPCWRAIASPSPFPSAKPSGVRRVGECSRGSG